MLIFVRRVRKAAVGVAARYRNTCPARTIDDVTQAVTMGAFVGMSDANVLISSRVPLAGVIAVGYRLLTAPFCEGFAGIEAFCAFLAVATHRVCQPRQESLFERNAAS